VQVRDFRVAEGQQPGQQRSRETTPPPARRPDDHPDQTTYDDRACGPARTGDRYRIATFGGGPGRSVIVVVDTTRPAKVRQVARNGETVWSEEVRYPADEGPEGTTARRRVEGAVTRAEAWIAQQR